MVSNLRVDISPFLRTYHVDPVTGFLPSSPPLLHLGADFDAWEDAIAELPQRKLLPGLRASLSSLPDFRVSSLAPHQCERAFLLIGMLAHAFVHGEETAIASLPAKLAAPWVAIAERLGRPPILAHGSLILQNWKKTDPTKGMEVENLQPLLSFGDSADESWFYMLTVGIEAKGARAIYELSAMLRAAKEDQPDLVAETLSLVEGIIAELTQEVGRMQEGCRPEVFYQDVRPFLSSFNNIEYQGTGEGSIRSYAGGSAAQSTLIQAIEAALALPHEESRSAAFLRDMRKYMPPAHRSFLSSLERLAPALVTISEDYPELQALRAACALQLQHFRNAHMKLVSQYILAHQPATGPGHTGTGGSEPMPFLRQLRNDSARFGKQHQGDMPAT